MKWIRKNPILAVLLFIAGCFFAYYIYNAVRWLPYPNSIDYGEGYVMNYAKLWASGAWKWNINVPPYLTMVYGVGFSVLVEPLVKIFGAQLWVGRAVSFTSALITCGIVYLIVKELTGKKSYGLLAALLPATQPIFRDWSVMARVDMPAVMFDMVGFYIALKFRNSKWFYLSVIPFVLAFMVKMTAIAGLGAVVVYLIIYNRKRILPFIGLTLIGLAAMIVPLMITSGGAYFKQVVLYQNTIENVDLPTFMYLFKVFIYSFLIVWVVALAYMGKILKKKALVLVGIFFIISAIIDLVSSLRAGAASMYYYEMIFAGCICFAIALPYMARYIKMRGYKIEIVTIFVVLFIVFGVYSIKTYSSFPDKQYDNSLNVAEQIMNDSQRPIVSENSALLLKMDRPLYAEYFIFTNLTRLHYWDDTEYTNQYKAHYFDYVLLKVSLEDRLKIEGGNLDGNFTGDILRAIQQNYTLVYQSNTNDWRKSMFLYEANDKLHNDNRLQQFNGEYYWRIE